VIGRAIWRRIVGQYRARRLDERGQVTAFVVVITMALILCAGLVIDGGLTLAAKVQATDETSPPTAALARSCSIRPLPPMLPSTTWPAPETWGKSMSWETLSP